MSTRHGGEGPEDIDAAFAEIVAGIQRDSPVPQWPDAEPDTGSGGESPSGAGPQDWSPAEVPEADDEGHYEPPEPPPLPRMRPATLGGLALIGLGLMLLIVPGLAGIGTGISLPLALISVSAGIGCLVLRARGGPPPGDGWDNGAQV